MLYAATFHPAEQRRAISITNGQLIVRTNLATKS
jgi:hypothetical protein